MVTISESMYVELQMMQPTVGISVLCPGWVRTRINESDRTRPGGAVSDEEAQAQAALGDADAAALQLKSMIDGFIAEGLLPAAVADLVIDAIRTRRFYVLTHPEWQSMVRDRVDRLLSGEAPAVSLPGN